jgi:hypothetical protein
MSMKALVFAASVACLVTGLYPAWSAQAAAGPFVQMAQADVRIGADRDRWRDRRGDHCREVTVRERHGDEVVVRHMRRCD